jgi:hypothetical protein
MSDPTDNDPKHENAGAAPVAEGEGEELEAEGEEIEGGGEELLAEGEEIDGEGDGEDEEYEDDDEEYEDDDDLDVTPERIRMMISGIQKHMPDAVIEVNGVKMTAQDIVAQFQSYLDAVAAADEAKRKLDEAEAAAAKSGEALEAAIREHHERTGGAKLKN